MDSTITIRTADDPPVELTASRAVLTAGSKVFADMLSMPQGGSDASSKDSFDVTETEKDFKPFLRLLNLAHEEGDPPKDIQDHLWPAIARLGDKYQAPLIESLAKSKYWEFKAKSSAPWPRFLLAAMMRNAKELREAALEVLPTYRNMVHRQMDYATSQFWSPKFELWKKLLKLHAFESSVHSMQPPETCSGGQSQCACFEFEKTWLPLMNLIMRQRFDASPASPFLGEITRTIDSSSLCCKHRQAVLVQVTVLELQYRSTMPDFPL
ncbi:hypothetical protein JCM10449v2_002831 [Rhodotorula kratochvilovae]